MIWILGLKLYLMFLGFSYDTDELVKILGFVFSLGE